MIYIIGIEDTLSSFLMVIWDRHTTIYKETSAAKTFMRSVHTRATLGTRSVFSRATRSFVVFSGHFEDSKPETAHEKPLAPRVHQSMSRWKLRFGEAPTFLNFASLNADCDRKLGAHFRKELYFRSATMSVLARVIWQYIGDETLHRIASSVQRHETHTYD